MPIDFDKIKALFILPDPNEAKQSAPENPSDVGSPVPEGNPAPSAPAGPGQVNPKFIEVLMKAMEAANLPGVDYLEYRQSVKSLEQMPMDEGVRFQSAFAMAQAMGATSQKLLESAQHYLNVLKTEESKFQTALKAQMTDRIGNRQEMYTNLKATIAQKKEQIAKLTQEIEQHQKEMEKLQAEVQDASAKLEGTKRDFEVSYGALAGQIGTDMDKIKQFLK